MDPLAGAEYDRRPTETGPEIYAHPTAGIFVATATDVTIRNCEVVWASRHDSFAHAVEAVDVTGLVIEGLRGTAAHPGQQAVLIRDPEPGETRYPAVVSG